MKSTDKMSVPRSIPVKAGPFGAPHKDRYVEWDDGCHSAVESIILTYTKGDCINCIQVEYRDQTGSIVLAPKHGRGGNTFEMIQISSAITWISGFSDSLGDIHVISSLKFGTKEGGIYGPYGSEYGTPFCFKVEKGICGFQGLTDDSGLRAIGVYASSTAKQHLSPHASVNSIASVNREEGLPVKAGPFGATHKRRYVEWDDASHSAGERIFLTYTKSCYINSIQVEYRDPDGSKVLAPKHGDGGGNTLELVQITSAITWISGHYDILDSDSTVIMSLKFGTKGGGIYGPYGPACGTPFCFRVDEGICGFHGLTDDWGLRAIGVYVHSTAKRHLGYSSASVNSAASIGREAAGNTGAHRNTQASTRASTRQRVKPQHLADYI